MHLTHAALMYKYRVKLWFSNSLHFNFTFQYFQFIARALGRTTTWKMSFELRILCRKKNN
jgi:hypothetical protein